MVQARIRLVYNIKTILREDTAMIQTDSAGQKPGAIVISEKHTP
jgi:hypothetical protein